MPVSEIFAVSGRKNFWENFEFMINVTKPDGSRTPFDSGKIRRSLNRVKTAPALIEQIIEQVGKEIYDGIPTSKLYGIVFRILKTRQRSVAAKYNLKQAIMNLGPTGFPFEKFIAAVFQAEGFRTETGKILQGCVRHEIDVIAEKGDLHYLMECKFHRLKRTPSDLKEALYIHARFLDIENHLKSAANTRKKRKMWLVTNTRLTADAVTYGNCAGLGLLSWDFPAGNGLRERIDRTHLHPITCLTTLSAGEKKQILGKSVVVCRELFAKPQTLSEIGIRQNKIGKIIAEVDAICSGI